MSRIRADRYTNREGTGAPTFSEGVNVVGVTSMSGDLAVTNGTITGPSQLTISGITSSISDTAVDVFVYDTRKDSDGGAWRKRTQNTSWYNETLGTATRGSRKEFPAVAVIVAEISKVTIYDGDDPDLPMWMVFNLLGAVGGNSNMLPRGGSGSESDITSIACLNGRLAVGLKDVNGTVGEGLAVIDFISELARIHRGSASGYTGAIYSLPILGRNSNGLYSGDYNSLAIIAETINDVAMTVLQNAPVDSATGLPVPTIAVATAGGVSVIKDDGTVVDITASAGGNYSSAKFISISSDGFLVFPQHGSSATSGEYSLMTIPIPSSDRTTQTNSGNATDKYIFNDTSSALTSLPHGLGVSQNGALIISGTQFLNYPNGLAILDENPTSLSNAMVAYIKSDYNTGWMHGNIKLATLSDTNATNVTGGTQPDRSINNNALTVNGTITKTAVATGAELVAFSGFSASNYLEQAYNSDMEFGTGDFYMMAWIKSSDNTNNQKIITRDLNNSSRCQFYTSGNLVQIYTQSSAGNSYLASTTEFNNDVWLCYLVGRSGGTLQMYVNGKSESGTGSNTSVSRDISFGAGTNLEIGRSNTATTNYFRGSIALARVGAGFPSPEQIKKMYDDEKFLFQENSQATLYGSSDAVTALAYDDTTELLHVGTSAGRSEFQGLRRINNTIVGITSAISASNELVAEQ